MKCVLALFLLLALLVPSASAAEPTAIPKIHVYGDGSVSVELTYTEAYEGEFLGLKRMRLQGALDVADGYYEVLANASLEVTSAPETRIYVDFSADVSGAGYNSTGKVSLKVWDEEGSEFRVALDPLTCVVDASRLAAEFNGSLNAYATSEAEELLTVLAALNKPAIEEFLEQANITWIKVKSLSTTIADSSASVDFKVELDYAELARASGMSPEQVMELLEPMPPTSFSLRLHYNATNLYAGAALLVHGDVNEGLAKVVRGIKMLGAYPGGQVVGGITPITPLQPDLEPLIEVMEEFAENFVIAKSRGAVAVEFEGGLLTISIATPKVVKRGSSLPGDTLLALYSLAAKVKENFGADYLLEASAELVPHGVKIRRGGAEVQEAKIGEMGNLSVTVVTSISISAAPAKATAGDSITVRGTIAPAISAPITLVVKEPDGAVRRLNATSGPDGAFAFNVRLDKVGAYTFTAEFQGDAAYEPSKSGEVSAEAEPAQTPLWLYAGGAAAAIAAAAAILLLRGRRAPRT